MVGDSDAAAHRRDCRGDPAFGNGGQLPVADLTEYPEDRNQRKHRQC